MTALVPPDVAQEIYHQVGDARTKTADQLDAIAAANGLTLPELADVCRRVSNMQNALTVPPVGVKVCSKCKVTQPLDEFHAHSQTRDGKSSQCRKCNSKRPPKASRIIRTRARGRAMYRLLEAHRTEFEQLLEEETVKAQAEHEEVTAVAAERGQPDAAVARLKSGPKRKTQTSATERLDVARCPKCHQFHDAGHQVVACDTDQQEAS